MNAGNHFQVPEPLSDQKILLDVHFNFLCHQCSSVLEASDRQTGSTGRCPTCGSILTIPKIGSENRAAFSTRVPLSQSQDSALTHAYAAAGDKAPQIIRLPDGGCQIACPRCQNISGVESDHCSVCGYPFTIEGANLAAQSLTDGYAIAAFLVSMVSLPLALSSPLGGIGSFVGAVCGWIAISRIQEISRARGGRGLALVGIILSAIGLTILLARHLLA